ncbi:MAG: Ser-Thr-rich GPI-anchored membrane family protein [Candidatus Pacebacteria bacterium]|nr:Ser-Thr-rich GPI-anchored membrane family protein [Candidatus Paceibacterota bacterium]
MFSVAALLSCRYSITNEGGTDLRLQDKNEKNNDAGIVQEGKNDEGDDSYGLKIDIIERYYELLSSGDLAKAYAMRAEQDVSFEEFVKWYGEVEYAEPYDFQDLGGDTFYFFVRYKDEGEDENKYGVKMVISENDKLSTIFVEEFMAENVISGEYETFSVKRGEGIYLIVKRDKEEVIVDKGDYEFNEDHSNLVEIKRFSRFEFSPKNDFLLYTMTGYEWNVGKVYDIKGKKEVLSIVGAVLGENFGVTPDEKYIYACTSAGFSGGNPGEVYSVPDFKRVFEAAQSWGGYMDSECEYNQEEDAIIFTLNGPCREDGTNSPEKIIKYSLKKLEIVSPAKDSEWVIGKSYELQWTPIKSTNLIDIALYDNSAESVATRLVWQTTAVGEVPNTGSYIFKVSDWINPGDKYQFHITEYENDYTSYSGNSEEFFITEK